MTDLECPNHCQGHRFEALNAPLYVDRQGCYVGHDARRVTFVCAACQCVAIDIDAAAEEMRHRPAAASILTLTCPSCATLMLPPDDDPMAPAVECPECGTRFMREEGMPNLHGSSTWQE